MIKAQAQIEVGGEYGYKVIVEDGGMYVKDGGQMIFIDEGDIPEVLQAMNTAYEEYKEFMRWQEKK